MVENYFEQRPVGLRAGGEADMTTVPAGAATRESDLAAFIDRLVAELQPLELEHNREYWQLATTGGEAHLRKCVFLLGAARVPVHVPY